MNRDVKDDTYAHSPTPKDSRLCLEHGMMACVWWGSAGRGKLAMDGCYDMKDYSDRWAGPRS